MAHALNTTAKQIMSKMRQIMWHIHVADNN